MSTVYLIFVGLTERVLCVPKKTSKNVYLHHDNGLDETVYVDTVDQIPNSGNNNSNKRFSQSHVQHEAFIGQLLWRFQIACLFIFVDFSGQFLPSLFFSHDVNCRWLNCS